MGYHGDPRPERPQPIGRDVGANEKARCWRVLRWLPGGTVRTGEYGCLRGWPLGSRVTGSGKTGCQERGSKRGRPHGLSAELVKPLVRPAKPLTGPVGTSAEPASALLWRGVRVLGLLVGEGFYVPPRPQWDGMRRLSTRETRSCLQLPSPEASCSWWESQQGKHPTSESVALSSLPGGDSSLLGVAVWPRRRGACRVPGGSAVQRKVYFSRATSCSLPPCKYAHGDIQFENGLWTIGHL